ncbi:DUF3926 domain-containing protein [Bacillus pseudomycoides]|uniref:DUF3926 domain-containing protein n=1 Tax=Bacillus pseudomycoides TaxID=64104 RepID=A0A2B6JVI9_9BACI|nr:DUF3926 domain-containing protein [Bacillus pseudomycoides]PDY48564.1 hypothetical protein CON79_02985 [Bacillus pseudomycoides]PED73923.1 hypothetical protein CON97_00180 [Bacillus pseudomycoides]PEI41034.1 hypothetical protein CN620_13945 [Bacillus pseudomycoides]PEJ80320.1 hypothetical protein CN680_06520 [Bacillus pseudomycoides]PEM22555.1 hypothetical protein CN628_00815 [Bacillus pseudomycoides]
MHEDLLRKVIHTKVEVGMYIINELPTPLRQQAKKMINILQEELSSCMQEKKQPTDKSLKNITIE